MASHKLFGRQLSRDTEHRKALRLAQALWRDLTSDDESAWAHLVGSEHPWTCVQLGRLAAALPRPVMLLALWDFEPCSRHSMFL